MSEATALMARGDGTREAIKSFIRGYHVEHGVAPSLTEIADGVGLASHNAVRTHLLLMQARGEVTWQAGKYRTIRVVDAEPEPASSEVSPPTPRKRPSSSKGAVKPKR